MKIKWIVILALTLCSISLNSLADDNSSLSNSIEKIDFIAQPGGDVAIHIQTKMPLDNPPAGFTLNSPPRIALDFPNTANGLSKTNLTAMQGALKSISLAQAKERTRMVLNLSKSVGYTSSVKGNEVIVLLQSNIGNSSVSGDANNVSRFAEAPIGVQTHKLTNVDFMRGKNGEGRIMVDLSDPATGIDLRQKGKTIVIDFINTDIQDSLQRRLNVINFNTPVLYVDTMKQGKNTRIVIEPKGNWEQSAYQADNKFIVDVRPVVEDPNKLVQGSKQGYAGEKLSLNFQNVDVRSVLQVIADFTGLNIITSDSVTGNLTLRLKDVPWDQALDIIMQSKGLTERKNGNVIVVAPTEEVAAKEKIALEATKQTEELEPLRTEVFTLKYQKAESVKSLLTATNSGSSSSDEGSSSAPTASSGSSDANNQRILSKRGSAAVDVRTNTIFVQDTSKRLEDVQSIINKIDIPVKQVLIESRLVIADEKFGKSLGAKFGVTSTATAGSNAFTTSGTLGNRFLSQSSDGTLTQGNHNGTFQTLQSKSLGDKDPTLTSSDGQPDLMSNLPVANAAGNIAFSLLTFGKSTLLNLELSALETDQRGKVVSSPRVITANQQKAIIEQGTEIPYITPASSATTIPAVAFKKAVLSLEVTPQITPDNKIIMDLHVKKDSVGQIYNNIPSIDTQNIQTQVLVGNGETAVLGGIFQQTERNDVSKVPFFGDLPFIGNAFKNTTKQNDKTELLIFVTPKVMDDSLLIQ